MDVRHRGIDHVFKSETFRKSSEFGCPNSGHETSANHKTVPRNFASARSPTCFNPAEQVSAEHSSHILDWKRKKLDDSPGRTAERNLKQYIESSEFGVNFRPSENYKMNDLARCEPGNGFMAPPHQNNQLVDVKTAFISPLHFLRGLHASPSEESRAATLTSAPVGHQDLSKKCVFPKIGSLPMAFTITKTPSGTEIDIFNHIYHSLGLKAMKHGVPKSNSFANVTSKRNVEFIRVPELNKVYRQGKLMGKGGFAKVYLVTNERTKEIYACKVIPRTVKKKQTHHILKIQQEIDIHKKLNHENVVKMHEAFSTCSDVYMLLEACPQKTLMHVLHYRKCLTEPETRYYMKQIVAGVEYIHSQNIIHRDLKPGNMFLSTEMIVKIGDFGLATIADKNRRMTVCGTPNYIAPEILKQQEYGFEADVWALGCTLHALLMGRPPFESNMLNETYDRIRKHMYLKIGQSLVSSWSEDLINKMLRPNPKDRATLDEIKEHSYFLYHYTPTYLPRTCCYQMPRKILEPSIARNQEPEPQAHYPVVHPDESLRHNVAHQQQSVQTQQEQPRHENSVNRCFWSNSFVSCSWRHKLNELLPSFRFRKTLFLKTDGLRKKKTNPILMYRALNACVKEMKPTSDNPQTVDHITPLFITRWIDFSLKYGLAFKLSDQSIGLVFNDNTKISYTHDRQKVEYATANDQIERYHRENDMPEQLKEKLKLLHRFTDYLNNRLIDGAELTAYRSPSKQKNACVPRMKRWMHIQDKGTVMELTKPLLQMNFTKDHTKIVLSYESKTTDYLVTYIDTSRQMTSYWLDDLRKNGCTADLYCRLVYLHETLLKFNEMDANTVSSS
ncbi:serine/threonine-protein kinase PLK1-like isoform X2 [Pseudomyrmex gracilis]|uniref:serine/threonine-protein kinase PLK1-like isoform X2 n=1 Tax=Pseudomyrmex gracilis TaxID=219809 RepID=UPI0009953589|nr:serine/threonine-protein kinase PLK1-like isoform X2 [Pseudomyrmex gracilis]